METDNDLSKLFRTFILGWSKSILGWWYFLFPSVTERAWKRWLTPDDTRSAKIRWNNLTCAHDIPDHRFITLNILSCWNHLLKIVFLSFPLFPSLLCYSSLNSPEFLNTPFKEWTLFLQSNTLSCSYLGFPFENVRIMLAHCFGTSAWVTFSLDPQILSK